MHISVHYTCARSARAHKKWLQIYEKFLTFANFAALFYQYDKVLSNFALWRRQTACFFEAKMQQKVYIYIVYIQYKVTLAKIRALSYGYPMGIMRLSYGKGSSCVRLWPLSGCTWDVLGA